MTSRKSNIFFFCFIAGFCTPLSGEASTPPITVPDSKAQSIIQPNNAATPGKPILPSEIKEISKNRDKITLKNGTEWKIHPSRKFEIQNWQIGDPINITESFSNYTLNNGLYDTTVEAEPTQPLTTNEKESTQEANPDQAAKKAEYAQIKEISSTRERIILDNGIEWKIALPEKFELRNWRINDKVKVTETNGDDYPYSIENTTAGSTVHAEPSRPLVLQKREHEQKELETRKLNNMLIHEFRNNGSIIELETGSRWEVAPVYQYDIQGWKKGERVSVEPSSDVDWPYWMYNLTQNTRIAVRLKKEANPNNATEAEKPGYYKGSLRLQENNPFKNYIQLEDGSQWRIKQNNIFNSQTQRWYLGDRIKVAPSDDPLYANLLENLENGDKILANRYVNESDTTPIIETPQPFK